MKIVLLTRSLGYGGAERQLTALAIGLKARGHQVTVLSFYDETPLGRGLTDAGVTLRIIGKKGRWDWIRFAIRVIRLVREERPDVLHSYLPVPNLVSAFLRPFFGRLKLIWGVRVSEIDLSKYDLMTRLSYRVERHLSRVADLTIVNSTAGLRYCVGRGFPQSRMRVIPNGVDVDRFVPDERRRGSLRAQWALRADESAIGLVARIDPLKDHETFLRAAAIVARERKDVRFICVGEGSQSLLEQLKALATQLDIAPLIVWSPAVDDVCAVYNALDVVCLSSYSEGFPNVLGEAMACGTPCVSTDVGDARMIIGECGLIVPPRAPELLAEAMVRTLDDLPRYRAVVRNQIAANFSVQELISRTENALEECLTS